MFEKKIDVDRHVEYCLKKINSETERNLRSFAFAKLYFNVGEYELARRYVANYLVVKAQSPEALLLLGKILEKLGKREAALEAYRTSLDYNPKQNGLVLKVCELLASDDVTMELSRARYWCEQAQLLDPQNPAVFNLREKLVTSESNSPEDIRKLFLSELSHRPTDIGLRVRLLHHMLQNNQILDAYMHVAEIEQTNLPIFATHLPWYETVAKILVRYRNENANSGTLTWEFWMLIISVFDKLASLYLDENLTTIKNLSECISSILNLDQTLTIAAENLVTCLEKQFSQEFLIHYRAQLCFHIATLVFKQAKKDQIKYKEAINLALPLLLISYHSQPCELQCVWLDHASEQVRKQVQRYHREASYRCSQSGHVLLSIIKDRKSRFSDRINQLCSGSWRQKTYKNIFITRDQQIKMKTSYFVHCTQFEDIIIRLPDASELLRYDEVAQLVHPNSLHHMIWIGLNNQPVNFRCTVFDGLQYSVRNLLTCGAETLNVLDIQAFLYCCVFCAQSNNEESKHLIYYNQEKPNVLPASITEPYGSLNQSKWYSSVYKMFRNECGSDMSDIRVTLIKGIEVVRCSGAHGLDVKLLVMLANTFAEKAKQLSKQTEIEATEARAELYWRTALPLLEKLRNNQAITYPTKRWFEYKGKEMAPTEINLNLEQGKLFTAVQLMKKKEHEKALQVLESLKNPYASFHQAQTYKVLADEQMSHNRENVTSEMRSQHIILLSKSRDCLYLTLDRLREPSIDRKHPLNSELGTEIEKIERLLSRIDPDTCVNRNECDGMSDENISSVGSMGEHQNSAYTMHSSYHNGNITPRNEHNVTATPYRNLDQSRRTEARPSPERLDAQLRQMAAAKDAAVSHIVEQNRIVMDAHRTLVDEIRGFKDAVSCLTSSVDELKGIKKSVDEIKLAVDDFQNLKEQVTEIKKDLSELKKDTNKLKNNQINDEDLYALDDEYGVDYNINAGAINASALYSNFPQRLQGPNTLAYGAPGLYGMYPMYPYGGLGLGQPGALPFTEGHVPDFRAMGSIAQGLSHTGLAQTQTHQPPMFAKLPTDQFGSSNISLNPVPAMLPQVAAPVLPPPQIVPAAPYIPPPMINPISHKPPPVNVVITASDPLPTTTVTQPPLSVTIPPQHLKGNHPQKSQPHNYQIPLPITTQPSFTNVATSITSTPLPISTHNLLINVAAPVYSSLSIKSPSQNQTNKGLGLQIEKSLTQNFNTSDQNRSNLSEGSVLEDHDPCPDFKPIVPLPDEVALLTGEENEKVLFSEHAKLYRFVEKEWRERGIGRIKLLQSVSGKVRLLMRRDQVHKICANHFITPDMELTVMKSNERAYIWAANDFADENVVLEKLCVRFKTKEEGQKFSEAFEFAKSLSKSEPKIIERKLAEAKPFTKKTETPNKDVTNSLGGFVFTSTPTFKPKTDEPIQDTPKSNSGAAKSSPFASFTFGSQKAETITKSNTTFGSEFKPVQTPEVATPQKDSLINPVVVKSATQHDASVQEDEDFVPTAEFQPVIPLPDLVEIKTGEENCDVLYEVKAKLLRFDSASKEWKERGVGIIKILKDTTLRLLMRREQVHKVCCNHQVLKSMVFTNMPKNNRVLNWCAQDFSENQLKTEMFAIRFRTPEICEEFLKIIQNAQDELDTSNNVIGEGMVYSKPGEKVESGWGEKFKPKEGNWECSSCLVLNDSKTDKCISCVSYRDSSQKSDCAQSPQKFKPSPAPPVQWNEKLKPKVGTWLCKTCLIHNDGKRNYCEACDTPKNDTVPKRDAGVDLNASGQQFSFGIPFVVSDSQKSTIDKVATGWGDAFKTKLGSWECKACYIMNDVGALTCVACNSPNNRKVTQTSVIEQVVSEWGEKFKPQIGFWECKNCLVMNNAVAVDCVACNTAKEPNKDTQQKSTIGQVASGWGDQYKPKLGSWECKTCLVTNETSALYCVACENPKDDTVPKKEPKGIDLGSKQNFTFGIPKSVVKPAATESNSQSSTIDAVATGWGDQFKPKTGSWKCQACYVANGANDIYCIACGSPKDDSVPKKESKGIDLGTDHKYSFGMSKTDSFAARTDPFAVKTKPTGFMFGVQQPQPPTTGFTFGVQPTPISITPVQSPLNLAAKSTFTFSLQTNAEPTAPQKDEFVFGSPNKHEFEFHPRSPRKTSGGEGDAESDGSGAEEECDNIYFKPVVPLPDKVEVRTGEEEELVLYCHRAKLYRFCSGEWKERGIGDIKILKHPQTAKLRIVMRREQILKICLNHGLTKEVEYSAKDERTWLFSAADYSEGEISYQQFCIRFKTAEIAQEFITVINDSLNDTATPIMDEKVTRSAASSIKETVDPDLVIVFETKVTEEEEAKALALQLPKNFYAYLQKPPCKGCIGCNPDDYVFNATNTPLVNTPITVFDLANKENTTVFGSAGSSIFGGTPTSTFSSPFTFTPQNKPISSDSSIGFFTPPSTQPVFGGFGSAKIDTSSASPMFGGSTLFGGVSSSLHSKTNPPGLINIKTDAPPLGQSAFGSSNVFGPVSTTSIIKNDAPTLTALLTQPSKLMSTPPSSPNPIQNEHKSPLAPSKLGTSNIFQSSSATQAPGNIFGPKTDSPSIFGPRIGSSNIFGPIVEPAAISKPITTIFGGSPSIFSGVKSETPKTSLPGTPTSIFGKSAEVNVTTPAFGSPGSYFGGTTTSEKRLFGTQANSSVFEGYGKSDVSVFGNPAAAEAAFGKPSQVDDVHGAGVPGQINIFGGLAAQKMSAAATGSIFGSNSTPVFGKAGFASQAPETAVNSDNIQMFSNAQEGPTFASLAQIAKPKDTDLVLKCDSNLSFAALATTPTQPTFTQQEEIKPFTFAGTGALVFGSKKTEKSAVSSEKSRPTSANQSTAEAESDGEAAAAAAETTEDYDPHYEPIVPLPDAIVVKTGEEDEDVVFKERAKLYRYNADTKEWKERGVGTLKLLFHPVNQTYRLLLRREQVHKLVLNQLVTCDLDLQPLQNSDRAWLWAGYNYSEDGSQLEKLAVRFKFVELAKQFYDAIEAAKTYLVDKAGDDQEDFRGNEDYVSDESDENQSIMCSKRCTLSYKSIEADEWNALGMGVLKMYFDPELYGSRIEMYDDSGQILSNTIIAINTSMRVEGNCCIWRSMEWSLDPAVPRILKAQFSSESAAQEMYYSYHESIQYAQSSDIYDILPEET